MKAIRVQRTGGPEVMELAEVPVPQPKPTEAQVKVSVAGVNSIDGYFRDGRYRELYCGFGHHASHGWWGSNRTIRPLASLSSFPSAAVMVAEMKNFLPSISVMPPWAVNGSSIGVMLR